MMNQKLVMKARSHDPDAFTELVESELKGMYRTAYAILLNDADAADAIQDTILTLWEKISDLKKVEYFRTWSTRILMNKCFDIRRRRSTEITTEEMQETPYEDTSDLEWRDALSFLDDKYRVPIELFYGQGYRTSEIAEMLDIPESTVRTRLMRGREKLKQYYNDKE